MKTTFSRRSPAARRSRIGPRIAVIVALFVAVPAHAQESVNAAALDSGQNRMPALTSDQDADLWSLALLGPAGMILVLTTLGLTITVRSLRAEARRRFLLHRYRQRGALSRAAGATRD